MKFIGLFMAYMMLLAIIGVIYISVAYTPLALLALPVPSLLVMAFINDLRDV